MQKMCMPTTYYWNKSQEGPYDEENGKTIEKYLLQKQDDIGNPARFKNVKYFHYLKEKNYLKANQTIIRFFPTSRILEKNSMQLFTVDKRKKLIPLGDTNIEPDFNKYEWTIHKLNLNSE